MVTVDFPEDAPDEPGIPVWLVKRLFADDRDEMQFKVTRYLTWDEIKKKKKTRCKGPVKETVIVTARDHQEAGEKVVNAVDAELIG